MHFRNLRLSKFFVVTATAMSFLGIVVSLIFISIPRTAKAQLYDASCTIGASSFSTFDMGCSNSEPQRLYDASCTISSSKYSTIDFGCSGAPISVYSQNQNQYSQSQVVVPTYSSSTNSTYSYSASTIDPLFANSYTATSYSSNRCSGVNNQVIYGQNNTAWCAYFSPVNSCGYFYNAMTSASDGFCSTGGDTSFDKDDIIPFEADVNCFASGYKLYYYSRRAGGRGDDYRGPLVCAYYPNRSRAELKWLPQVYSVQPV